MRAETTFVLLCFWGLLFLPPAWGQSGAGASWEEAACRLLGAGTPEELDESALEQFEAFTRHPLPLNRAGAGRLRASGLLSSYQLAALLDYRARSGAVLSFTELAAIDGFGPATAEALRHFTVLDDAPPARRRGRQELTLTAGRRLRQDKPGDPVTDTQTQALKYQLEQGPLHLLWSTRRTYGEERCTPGTFSAALETGRGRIVAGDYQIRLGQGLLLWSGFSMSGFPAAGAFCRNATGLSETGAWAPGHRGLAAERQHGSWTGTLALSLPGLRERMDGASGKPVGLRGIASLTRLSRNAQVGLNLLHEEGGTGLSADIRAGLGPFRLFGEAACCRTPRAESIAAVAGLSWQPSYGTQCVLLARAYPAAYPGTGAGAVRSSSRCSDENGLALGLHHKWLDATFDRARHPQKQYTQSRGLVALKPSWERAGWNMTPALRATLRYREDDGNAPTHRADLRFDLGLSRGGLSVGGRAHFSHAQAWGRLFLVESGWTGETAGRLRWGLFLRGSLHRIAHWDERISVYERDFPGSFNLPAYCGSGHALSACGSLSRKGGKSGTHTLRARVSLTRHPAAERPTTAEIRFQYQWKFP